MNADRDSSSRPVFDLIRKLPCCEVSATGEIDYDASDPGQIQRIGEYAALVMATVHRGTAAIGLLLANAGPEIETRSLSAEVVADLGFLLAELADLAAQCDLIATGCRRATADYLPLVLRNGLEPVDNDSSKS